ncbi:MAG: DUF3048 domain-containing protein [Oscillospiraceae bacterium]|nr:DUF3048 domain-containing protein [Oscillospiraceae bacterium]
MERKARTFALLLLCALLCLLCACGSTEEQDGTAETASPSAQTSQDVSDDEDGEEAEEYSSVNPLTGLPMEEELVSQRPVAVMLNNLKAAMPQLGTSQADIIYEILVEGGITRMLALYQDPSDVELIGSVRSARPYYVELAAGHDAIFLHAGGSDDAYSKISSLGVTAFDCLKGYEGTLFWRDADRVATNGSVHSVVTSGEAISSLLPTYNVRTEHQEGYTTQLQFASDGTPEGGEQALTLTVPFSSYKTGIFTYDETSGKYLVSQYGAAQVDCNTGEQLAVTNVLLLKTSCSVISGDSAGRMSITLTGEGEGWFACGGQYIPICWSREDSTSQLVYTTQSGDPLTLGAGNSYICIIPLSSAVTIE